MCVVDVGSFDSKSLTPSNQKRTHTHSYTPLASRKNEQSLRSEQDEPTNCSRSEKSERKSSEWQGKKPVHTIPSCTECLIHFNVQYKIMFDYISDIFTRLVHEMHAQHCVSIFLSTSSVTAFFSHPQISIYACRARAAFSSFFIFRWMQWIAENPRHGRIHINTKHATRFAHSFTHSLTHRTLSREKLRKLERQKHARRIIYHLDAIEGSFFHCLSSRSLSRHFVFYYKLSIQNNIQCLCLYTSSPNHYYRFISQINSKSVPFLVRSHFIFYIFGFWCSVFEPLWDG